MQKIIQLTALLLLSLTLIGCPMDTSVPIEDPKANLIDNNLLGNWKNRSDGKIYAFSQYDAYTYKVSYTLSDGTTTNYYPFMSFVNNQSFICVPYYDAIMEENRYALFGITTSNHVNTLHIRGLKNTYDFSLRTIAELRNWIANNMNSNNFYSEDPDDSYILDRN